MTAMRDKGRTRARRAGLAAAATVAAWALGAVGVANADFGIAGFDGATTADGSGAPYTQAGGHPFAVGTVIAFNSHVDDTGQITPDGGGVKDLEVDLPVGFVGDTTAVPTCRPADFAIVTPGQDPNTCPASTQVGVTTVALDFGLPFAIPLGPIPVYNMEPPPGVPAAFAFKVFNEVVFLQASVRPDDYGIRIKVRNASEAARLIGTSLTFWGTPWDPAHDGERYCQVPGGIGCSVDGTPRPLLTLPTSCPPPGTGLRTTLRANPWDDQSNVQEASFISHDPPGFTDFFAPLPPDQWGPPSGPTNCGELPFDPSVEAKLDTTTPDAPSSLEFALAFPQDGLANPTGLATAHLKDARVTLPEGMTISPALAGGLQACTDEQLKLGSDDPVECPLASKIGTVVADTPILAEPLEGGIYVGSQKSNDPESGDMFRMFLVLENKQRGLLVKLPGKIRADADSGRIEATFENNPQLPVSRISLQFKTGSRAPLATPPTCGPQTFDATLSSWAGHVVDRTATVNIDCPGATGFAPAFAAGTLNPIGGAFSPFTAQIVRPDRQQYLSGVTLNLPPGVLARLKDVPLCGDAAASAGTCAAESRVGTATVAAGPGATPFRLSGPVFLTEGYKGAPYGLSVAVPVVAGPFDLGTVVVRQAIFIDPDDARITVVSDPLPVIVKGVPVRLRTVDVDVDRPGFTLNPTSCAKKQVGGTFQSSAGAVVQQTVSFQAADCRALPLSPRLQMQLTGKRQLNVGRHPGLKAVLKQPAGQAGIRKVAVSLPLALALDPENAQSDGLCEFEAGKRADCPPSSIIGTAKAFTPLLNRPLSGPVYFVKNVRTNKAGRQIRTLPTLLVALRGEVALNLRATTSVKNQRLVSTFAAVPDAPVSRFELTLKGGSKGILVVTGNRGLCASKLVADADVDGQSGRRADQLVRMRTPCAAKGRARGN